MTALRGVPADFGYAPAREARLASRLALERALATTCLLAGAVFAACWLASGLLPARPYVIPVPPGFVDGHDLIDVEPLPGTKPPVASPATQPEGVPLPVPDDLVVAAAEPAPVVAGGPAAPSLPGQGGGVGPAVDPVGGAEEPPPPGVFHLVEELPEVAFRVAPEYPELAREAQVEGTVHVWVLVGLEGRVEQVRVNVSVPLLDAAAVAAVSRWRFTPALNNGKPVRVWVSIPVRFSLH